MLIRCRPWRQHQRRLASGLVTSYENVSPPASPLFECAIVGIRDDDERNFFRPSLERRLGPGMIRETRPVRGKAARNAVDRSRSVDRSGEPGPVGMPEDSMQRALCFSD